MATAWDLEVEDCSRTVISDQNAVVWVRTDRGDLVVKWSRAPDRFARLEASTGLLRTLAEHGVPVAVPVPTVSGRDRVTLPGPAGPLSVTVLPELAGTWLDVADPAAVRSAGACLAQVHDALRDVPCHDPPWTRPATGLRERVEGWLRTDDPGFAPGASARLAELLPRCPELQTTPQLVHGDFRAANVLTLDSRVVGVLDVDDVAVAHPVEDLARASVYLATRFTGWGPTSPAVRAELRAGYESVRPLAAAEARWLEALQVWQGLLAVLGPDDPAGWAAL
nr:phosphotransferase [Kineococcus siccus]